MWYEICVFFRREAITDNRVFIKSLLKKLSGVFAFDEFAIRAGVPSKRIPKSKFFESKIPKDAEIVCDIFELGHDMDAEWSQKIDWRVGRLSFNWPFYDKNDPDYYEEKYGAKIMGKDYVLLLLNVKDEALNFSFSEPKYNENRLKLHDLFLTLIEHNPARIFIITEHKTKEMNILPVYYDSIDTFLKVLSYYQKLPELTDELKEKFEENLPALMAYADICIWSHKKGFSLHLKEVVEHYNMWNHMKKAEPYKFDKETTGKLKAKIKGLRNQRNEIIHLLIVVFLREFLKKEYQLDDWR